MLFLPEIIITSIFVIGICVYAYLNRPAKKAEKLQLLKSYRRAQNLSMKLQDIISTHILVHDAYHDEFVSGMSYADYLEKLQIEHSEKLPEAIYIKLRNGNSSYLKKKTIKLLEIENERLSETKKMLAPISNIKRPA